MAPTTDSESDVHVDGVLNVGIQDDGNAPILLKTNELQLARELCAAGYTGPEADTARRICALASHAADNLITFEALASQDHLSKVLLGRLSTLIEEAGNNCHVVLSSSWRKRQHVGRRKLLEDGLAQCLGRPFAFDGVTGLLLPERHAGHRLAAIRLYLSEFAQKDLLAADCKVIVLDDFFLSPIAGWECGSSRISDVMEAEAYLAEAVTSYTHAVGVKILHCYAEIATGGFSLQVGIGLSGSLLEEAKQFLNPLTSCHVESAELVKPPPSAPSVMKEGAWSKFIQLFDAAFVPPTTPVLWVV